MATDKEKLDAIGENLGCTYVPRYSRWFSYTEISECEMRLLPEFFDGRCRGKTPKIYTYLRNSIVRRYRENPNQSVTFTDVRKTLLGDVGSIRRVYDFLETWGLINNPLIPSSSAPLRPNNPIPIKQEEHSTISSPMPPPSGDSDPAANKKRTCGGCKSACSIACFSCEKYDLTLCARCYVRGNYRPGVSSSDFKRIEISEDQKREWTSKEMLLLLESINQFGDDWKKVAQQVTGRTERECILQFIKLPFAEELSDHASFENDANRSNLNPLADASNPIMAQAAFLSALAGVHVAESSARAAVSTLTDVDSKRVDSNELARMEANALIDKEELDSEQKLRQIILQVNELQRKIESFEESETQMEKERQQLDQLRSVLFADKLNLAFKTRS